MDDMIVYIENSKELTTKFLELIGYYSKFERCKVNVQKVNTFLIPAINKQNFKLKTYCHLH